MDDNKLDVTICRTIGLVLITIILSIFGACQNTKWTIKKMVEAGTDPVSAACALSDDGGNPSSALCVSHELHKNK